MVSSYGLDSRLTESADGRKQIRDMLKGRIKGAKDEYEKTEI